MTILRNTTHKLLGAAGVCLTGVLAASLAFAGTAVYAAQGSEFENEQLFAEIPDGALVPEAIGEDYCYGYLCLPNVLGATLVDNPDGLGALVDSVDPGGALDDVGVEVGDIILAIDGNVVVDAASVFGLIGNPLPGTDFLFRIRDVNTGQVFPVWVTV